MNVQCGQVQPVIVTPLPLLLLSVSMGTASAVVSMGTSEEPGPMIKITVFNVLMKRKKKGQNVLLNNFRYLIIE